VKNKYMFGGVIAVVFLGMMVYLFTKSNIQYESDFAKVMSSDRTIKATGSWVKEKNYEVNKSEKTFVFYMKDTAGKEMKVIYAGSIPNNFESAQSIVVTGQYKNGNFHAKDILTKCPSKYQDKQNAAANS